MGKIWRSEEGALFERVGTPEDIDAGLDTDPLKFLQERAKTVRLEMLLLIIVLAASVATNFYVMFEGLSAEMSRDSASIEEAQWQAAAICGMITLAIFVSWHVFFALGPKMLRNWAGLVGYVAIVLFTGATLIVSSALNYQGLVHLNVMPRYLLAETNKLSVEVDELTSVSQQVRGLLPSLASLESDACILAAAEERSGLASGTGAGFGQAAAAFTSACEGVKGLKASMAESLADADENAAALSARIEALLRSVEDRSIPILEREDRFRKLVAELDTLMRTYRNSGLGYTVKAGVGTLRNLVAAVDESSGLRASARAAINGLRSKLEGAADTFETVLNVQNEAVSYTRPERLSLGAISRQYIASYPSQAALAVFLDLWPLAMYSFALLVGVGVPKPDTRCLGEVRRKTVTVTPVRNDEEAGS